MYTFKTQIIAISQFGDSFRNINLDNNVRTQSCGKGRRVILQDHLQINLCQQAPL